MKKKISNIFIYGTLNNVDSIVAKQPKQEEKSKKKPTFSMILGPKVTLKSNLKKTAAK